MSDNKIRVKADCYNEYKGQYGEFMGEDIIPVDLYGKRVWSEKRDSNFQEAGEDIQEFYGLTGKKGLV